MRDSQMRIEHALDGYLPNGAARPERLHEAMRYSVMDGGKRVRPMLVYAAGRAVNAPNHLLDAPACAIEMVHVYSLIHDDLPAMDNDDLRRGRPTCHKAYDDATAILAGDALQPLAFDVIANESRLGHATRLKIIQTLAMASGSLGMAGGQAIDLEAETRTLTLQQLEEMHARKTGALIHAAIQTGALCNPDVSEEELAGLEIYGKCIGLAFQIQDDILDEIGDTEKLGKPQGSDRQNGKSTFVSLCGLETSKKRKKQLLEKAVSALDTLQHDTSPLIELGRYIVQRDC